MLTLARSRRILPALALTAGIVISSSASAFTPPATRPAPPPRASASAFTPPATRPAPPPRAAAAATRPVFAYYYMWMTSRYWRTHKKDHPAQPFPGNYDSANPAVISWQIKRAKAAGISGFIVSWKNNATYRRILPRLERAANRHHFKLAMAYESLNLRGRRLPVSRVAADFQYFAAHYARNRAWYRISGKPLTVWSGTDYYSPSAVAHVTRRVRGKILVLNSASTVREFRRLARSTDGDAYYWSSINPIRNPAWARRLGLIAAAVHRRHKIWIAPFAPGFDARLIGGHINVGRDGGLTLRLEYRAAAASSPTILGLISWNEWTENTYMEPSLRFGSTYLNVLKSLR